MKISACIFEGFNIGYFRVFEENIMVLRGPNTHCYDHLLNLDLRDAMDCSSGCLVFHILIGCGISHG